MTLPALIFFSPSSLTASPSPSRMKTSCSHGWLWNGLCPFGSISKSLIAKFGAPISFVMSHRTFSLEAPSSASFASTFW